MKKKGINKYKITTAIWVLSCNDIPPQMTYRGIMERIDNVSLNEIKDIVSEFPELFQVEIPKNQYEKWKVLMKNGKERPKWIAQADSEEIIDNLNITDVFRNRFRNSINAKVVSNSILDWGINYIHEYYEKKEIKKEKFWNRFISLILPILSILVVAYSSYTVYQNEKQKIEIEKIKTNINKTNIKSKLIYPIYNNLVEHIGKSMLNGFFENGEYRMNELSKARIEIYKLMPFINDNKFDSIKIIFSDFHNKMIKHNSMLHLSNEEKNEIFVTYSELLTTLWEAISDEVEIEKSN